MSDSNPSRTQHEFSNAILGAAPRIRSFLRRLSGNSQAVEDMAQDVLERALRYRQAFDPTAGTLDNWLMKTAFHIYLDHRKRSDRQPTALGEAVQSVHGRDINPAELRDEVAKTIKPLLDASDRAVDRGANPEQGPAKYALIPDKPRLETLLRDLKREKGVEIIVAPKLTTLPLTRIELHLGKKIPYVKDFNIEIKCDSFVADPVVATIAEGLLFGSTIAQLKNGMTAVDFAFTECHVVRPIKVITTKLAFPGAPLKIQLPEVKKVSLRSRVELRENQTALFALRTLGGKHGVLLLHAIAGQ